MADLRELCDVAVASAKGQELVEAYAQEARETEASALRGEVEGLSFSHTKGLGVRVIRDGRMGYAWASDPTEGEVKAAVAQARENASLAEPDEHNVLPDPTEWSAMPALYQGASAQITAEQKVAMALDLEARAVSRDPRVTKIDMAQVGDAVSTVVIASTAGVSASYERTDAWCVVVTLATEGDETQTGFSYAIARGLDELDRDAIADEAVDRGLRLLGAAKPETAKLPVIMDQFAAMNFLGVLAGPLSAEAAQKGRSLFAGREGEQIGSKLFTLVDDGTILDGPGACPFDDEGVPSGRTELFTAGTLNGFLHDSYTASRAGGGQRSTGNGKRGYSGPPSVAPSNFYMERGTTPFAGLLKSAEGGVLIMDVSGVHSGANPISGEFSVGATGVRIRGGELAEPLREMTIASTLPEMLAGVSAVGDDLRFFSSVGTPSILFGEMTLAGI
ncbi:MAG: PmbA protein [Actinomycetota bacterium]|nr:PmbA protein [Actinomycetota bacterium]